MTEKIWFCDDEVSARFPVYTRANAGEVFSVAVSPLTWTAYGRRAWETGYRDALYAMGVFTPEEFGPVGVCECVGCFGGYVYLNVSVTRVIAVRIPGLTIEAIDTSFFGEHPDVPPHRPDPRDDSPARSAAVSAWLAALPAGDPRNVTDQDRRRIDALIAAGPELDRLSDAALLAQFRSYRDASRHMIKRHMLNTYGANVMTGLVAQMAQAVDASELAARATAAVGDVDSARQSFELWEVSRSVKSVPAVAAAFDAGVEGVIERLRGSSDRGVQGFLSGWDAFIDRWGFIGPDVWEFGSPTYRTNPEIVLRMLDRARHAPDAAAPGARAAALIEAREKAIADIAHRYAGDGVAQAQFLTDVRAAGEYLAARERSKIMCTRTNEAVRAPIRVLGERFVERGLLPRWPHVLLVTDDEADAFVADPAAYAGAIAERAARFEMLRSKEPPFVFEGEPPPWSAYKDRGDGGLEPAPAGTRLTGIGVAPGRHTGRARVITSLDEASGLEPGEVIVAVITDSSWGPLFLAAGAVVVETGSTISHAAIVSRELGIPATVSVDGATRKILNGATVTVDGDAGTVLVH